MIIFLHYIISQSECESCIFMLLWRFPICLQIQCRLISVPGQLSTYFKWLGTGHGYHAGASSKNMTLDPAPRRVFSRVLALCFSLLLPPSPSLYLSAFPSLVHPFVPLFHPHAFRNDQNKPTRKMKKKTPQTERRAENYAD